MTIEDNKRKINKQNRANLDHINIVNKEEKLVEPRSGSWYHLRKLHNAVQALNDIRLNSNDPESSLRAQRALRSIDVLTEDGDE
jgi:hypothetical protein